MYIVTTTINAPTKATLKFAELANKNGWVFVIVGDQKTPDFQYRNLESRYPGVVVYLDCVDQTRLYPELSEIIGWKTIQRRNIGFVYAYKQGAEIIATVDDDNIPYDNWGQNLLVGKEVEVDMYKNKHCNYFDPFSVTNHNHLWHRGYPLECLDVKNNIDLLGRRIMFASIQADFWDGDPDIDAICRLTKKPLVKFNKFEPFTTNQFSPFNSQNTFIHRSVFPFYSVWPGVGRMDDIWAGYYAEAMHHNVVYCPASVYQERNPQDLVKNLENECIGYRHTLKFLNGQSKLGNYKFDFMPAAVDEFLREYEKHFES